MNRTRHCIAILALSLACITAPCMAAVAWPEKSVRLLVPWAPGGSTDVVARIISSELTKRFKQTVLVDNRPGAGSILGMHLRAACPRDDSTPELRQADTSSGNTQINLGSVPAGVGYIRSGRLKALGVGATKRNPQLPNVPTMTEAGVPGFVTYIWWGVFAPLKTPQDVIKRMHDEIAALQDTPDVVQKLEQQGAMPVKQSSAEFGKYMQDEAARWQMVIDKAGIKGE